MLYIELLFFYCRLAVNLYFAPTSEKEVNFNLVCKIQRRVLPVTLNVKAEGYTMNCLLLCEDSAGNRVQLSSRGINQINFGDVSISVILMIIVTKLLVIVVVIMMTWCH